MKINTALKICKSIGDSRYLDTEKLTAIKTVVTATSSARQLSVRDLNSMLEFLVKVILKDGDERKGGSDIR